MVITPAYFKKIKKIKKTQNNFQENHENQENPSRKSRIFLIFLIFLIFFILYFLDILEHFLDFLETKGGDDHRSHPTAIFHFFPEGFFPISAMQKPAKNRSKLYHLSIGQEHWAKYFILIFWITKIMLEIKLDFERVLPECKPKAAGSPEPDNPILNSLSWTMTPKMTKNVATFYLSNFELSILLAIKYN